MNIALSGYTGNVVERMVRFGYAKTKTEAVRLALYHFDQSHKITDEEVFGKLAGKILEGVDSGRIKTRKFGVRELG